METWEWVLILAWIFGNLAAAWRIWRKHKTAGSADCADHKA